MQIQLPPLHEGQLTIANHPARFKTVACGRRWGKTRLGTLLCLKTALNGGIAWWVAPTYKVGEIGWRLTRQLASRIPGATISLSDKTISYGNGMVQVRSADNPDSLRGEGLDFLVMDECAYSEERAWLEVLRPSLSDKEGGAMFISTPSGRNWFWKIFQLSDGIEWQSFNFPTSNNPYISSDEIDTVRASMTDITFRQEFLAEFIQDGIGVFHNIPISSDIITAHLPFTEYVMGVDWAKFKDYTVFTVIDTKRNCVVAIERYNMIDYQFQLARLNNLVNIYQPRIILAEANAMGEPLIEQLERDGLPIVAFTTSNASKKQIIENLALAFESGQLIIPDNELLVNELLAFETSRTPSGLLKYSAAAGFHDDMVISLALAYEAQRLRFSKTLVEIPSPVYDWRGSETCDNYVKQYKEAWGIKR